jgi:cell division protein ZapA
VSEAKYLDVSIMGREYRVTCEPDQRDALLAAVALVDEKMREIADKSKNATAERVAVMAALNIAHETLAGQGAAQSFDFAGAKRRIGAMEARLDAALSKD